MQIHHIPLDHLSVCKSNMRVGKKAPDVSDILPSIIKRGVISPFLCGPILPRAAARNGARTISRSLRAKGAIMPATKKRSPMETKRHRGLFRRLWLSALYYPAIAVSREN